VVLIVVVLCSGSRWLVPSEKVSLVQCSGRERLSYESLSLWGKVQEHEEAQSCPVNIFLVLQYYGEGMVDCQ
jgi:hypothetical protein